MMEKPQMVIHIEKTLDFNAFDVKWLPHSAKLVVMGSCSTGTGKLQLNEMSAGKLEVVSSTELPHPLKCGTFRASCNESRHLAVGDFHGGVSLLDLSRPDTPIHTWQGAHTDIVNTIDGIGGIGVGEGAAELVTGGSDSLVKVWDPREQKQPVVVIKPETGSHKPDCWAVAAGNAYTSSERAIVAGFDNGDVKMFDLRTNGILWETNIRNGVCSLEFDRRDIQMNKLIATTLESNIHVFDLRTLHPTQGFASCCQSAHNSTVWCVKHLPQNRDVWMTTGGNGSLNLWRYVYPSKRSRSTDNSQQMEGVAGTLECLQDTIVSTQPITSFDWSVDRQGLGALTAIDQTVRIVIVTKLNTL